MRIATTDKPINLSILMTLSALMAITSLAVDVYLPALPTMARMLGGNAELTVTGFLLGFTIAQLVWGPITDRIGRKLPLFIGMVLFITGSVGCALSQSMAAVIFWRVFQAVGACIGPMLSRAMIRDLYGQSQAAHMLSTLMIIMAVAPIGGPLLGGWLLKISSWHAIFWLLAGTGVIIFLAVFRLPESLPVSKRSTGSFWQAFINYGKLLKNRRYMRYTLCVTFFYLAAYAFITGSPFVYINYFKVAPQYYGYLFGINIIGLTLLAAVNRKLVTRFSLDTLLRTATLIATLAASTLLVCSIAAIGGVWGVIIPIFVIFSMNGIIAACTNAAALNGVPPEIAGSAAALLGSMQYGSGIISSMLLVQFSDGTPRTMAWIMAIFVTLSGLMVINKGSTV